MSDCNPEEITMESRGRILDPGGGDPEITQVDPLQHAADFIPEVPDNVADMTVAALYVLAERRGTCMPRRMVTAPCRDCEVSVITKEQLDEVGFDDEEVRTVLVYSIHPNPASPRSKPCKLFFVGGMVKPWPSMADKANMVFMLEKQGPVEGTFIVSSVVLCINPIPGEQAPPAADN